MKPIIPSTDKTMEKAIRRDRIDSLLALAREAEDIESKDWSDRAKVNAFFTCNRVTNALGSAFAYEYQRRFCPSIRNEPALWNDPLCMSRRILSLCFMAAMVEAGDA